jgi:hypothetical protein
MSDKLSSSDFNSFQDFIEKIDNCEPGSMFALNPQCTAACLCHDGLSEVVQCPVGLAYDSHADKCLLPHLAKWYKSIASNSYQSTILFQLKRTNSQQDSNYLFNLFSSVHDFIPARTECTGWWWYFFHFILSIKI